MSDWQAHNSNTDGGNVERNGSTLYRLLTHPWQDVRYFPDPYPEDRDEQDAYVEPHDPPRFLLGNLPADLRDRYAAEGEPHSLDAVLEAGVESLEWRNHLRHLEHEWISEAVFDALHEIAPNMRSLQSFVFIYGDIHRRYHVPTTKQWPPERKDDKGRVLDYWMLDKNGDQLLAPGQGLSAFMRERDLQELTLFYPSWMDRDDVVMWLGPTKVVTEGFVSRWRETEISRYLQQADFEDDLAFRKSNGQLSDHSSATQKVSFEWIDVPRPDWVEDPYTDAPR